MDRVTKTPHRSTLFRTAIVPILLLTVACSDAVTSTDQAASEVSDASNADSSLMTDVSDAIDEVAEVVGADAQPEISTGDDQSAEPDTSGDPDLDPTDLPVESDVEPPVEPDVAPAADCPVDPMDELYPGFIPPNPYLGWPRADACVGSAHDVIILLGCPNKDDGEPADCQTRRADMAVDFWESGYAERFITTGAAVHNEYVEAETLRDLLIERGVAEEAIWLEPRAEHTDENLYYSSLIMQDEGWASAIVISSDPGHMMMTAMCDSNCCVGLGRFSVHEFVVDEPDMFTAGHKAGHYVLFPWADPITTEECDTITLVTRAMCTNLASRRACEDDFQLSD